MRAVPARLDGRGLAGVLCVFEEARRRVFLPIEFFELAGLLVVGVGVVVDLLLQHFAQHCLLDVLGAEQRHQQVHCRHRHRQRVDRVAEPRRLPVDLAVPVQVAHREQQQGALEALYDQPSQLVAQVDGTRHLLKEQVLVHPVLQHQHQDEDGGGEGHQQGVERNEVGHVQVVRVLVHQVELLALQSLVQLHLEQVDVLGGLELPLVEEGEQAGFDLQQVQGNFDEGTEAGESQYFGDESLSAHEVHGGHPVEDEVDHRGVQELGNHVLENQRTHPRRLRLMLLHLRQGLQRHPQQDVDHVGQSHHQQVEQKTDQPRMQGRLPRRIPLQTLSPNLETDKPAQRKHQTHRHYQIRVKHLLQSITVADLHVVPKHVVGLGGPRNFGLLLLVEGQEPRVPLVLPQEVVPVVLVLEGDEGPAHEVREGEGGVAVLSDEVAQVDVSRVYQLYLIGNVLNQILLPRLLFSTLHLPDELVDQRAPEAIEIFEFGEVVANGDGVDDGHFFQFFWFLPAHHPFVEVVFEVGQSAQLFLVGLHLHFLDPGPDFGLDGFLDELPVVEGVLLHGPVLAVVDEGGDVLDQDGKVILGHVVVLQEVVEFVGVQLVPDEVSDGDHYED